MNPLLALDIPRRTACCSHKQEPFAPGTLYYSTLILDESEKITRKDFCPLCWKQEEENYSKAYPHWLGKVPPAAAVKKPKDKSEKALELLRESVEVLRSQSTDESSENSSVAKAQQCFILALYLIRCKKIQLQKEWQEGDGKTLWLCMDPLSEEVFILPRLPIDSSTLETLREQLARALT
jgi:hypothetical protein